MSSRSASSGNRLLLSLTWRLLLLAAPPLLLALVFPRFLDAMAAEPILRDPSYLKGGSVVGFRYAYLGALCLLGAQLYTLAKTIVIGSGFRIKLSRWLSLHCLLNVTGGTLLLLHSGFPYSFRYFDPFTPLLQASWLPSLVSLRGLLTWLLLGAGASGFLLRHLQMRAGLRRSLHLLHIWSAALVYGLGLLHIYLSAVLQIAR